MTTNLPAPAGNQAATRSTAPPALPLVVAGAVVGLTWAAALRGWMVQMAGDESGFHLGVPGRLGRRPP